MFYAHKSRFTRIAETAGSELPTERDVWGETMRVFFAVAEVLHTTAEVVMESDGYHDHALEAFARWDYLPSPYVAVPDVEAVAARASEFSEGEFSDDYSYATVALASAYVNGELTQEDLIYAGDVLSRYSDMLRTAGKDY